MRISEVFIKNFRGVGEFPFQVAINENVDILMLVGPNGFGKTTFFDAIEWAFTGQINRIEELKDVDKNRFNVGKFINFQEKENQINKKNRFAEVNLKLSDGSFIRRTNERGSKQQVGDYAKNKLQYIFNNINVCTQSDFEKFIVQDRFLNNISFIEQFYHSHILGQDTINSFIHNYKGSSRQEKVFAMIGMKNFQEIKSMLDPNRGLYKKFNIEVSTRNSQYEKLKSDVSKLKENLNYYLKKCNLDDINLLYNNMKSEIAALIEKLKEGNIDIIKEDAKQKFLNLELRDIPNFKKEVDAILFNISSEIDKLKQRKKGLSEYQENIKIIKKLDLLLEAATILNKIEHFKTNFKNINKNLLDCKVKNAYPKNVEKVNSLVGIALTKYDDWIGKLTNLEFNYSENDLIQFRHLKMVAFFDIKIITDDKLKAKLMLYYHEFDGLKLEFNSKMRSYLKLKKEYDKSNVMLLDTSKLNSEYKNFLVASKNFIEQNKDIVDTQKACPLCKQEIISKDDITSNKLIDIINSTLTTGDLGIKNLKDAVATQKELMDFQQKQLEELLSKIKNIVKEVLSLLTEQRQNYVRKSEKVKKSISNKEKRYLTKCKDEQIKYKLVTDIKNELFKEILDDSNLMQKLEELSSDKEQQLELAISSLEKMGITIIDRNDNRSIKTKLEELKKLNEDNHLRYFREYKAEDVNEELLEKCILGESNKLNSYSGIEKMLNDLKLKFFPDTYSEEVFNIVEKEEELKKAKLDLNAIEEQAKKLEKLSINVASKTDQIIKDTIEKNKLVCSLYEAINPHPFYRDLRLQQRNDGIEMMCEGMEDRLFLDYIFSSAQNNVLALSIFLGFALQQQWSKLEQVFIDDPIQNMDDINILSFIDIIRSLFFGEKFRKQIVISTHDNKLAELFRRKFRYLNVEIIRFESYTDEGPVVRHYNKYLQPVNY